MTYTATISVGTSKFDEVFSRVRIVADSLTTAARRADIAAGRKGGVVVSLVVEGGRFA